MISRKELDKVKMYFHELDTKRPSEVRLKDISKMFKKIGFEGPINKPGSARKFKHDLLDEQIFLNKTISIHVLHGRSPERITFRDYKKYLRFGIHSVIFEIENRGLVSEG